VYQARWGETTRKAEFRAGQYHIEVLKWDSSVNGEGVDIYATLGASVADMPGAESGHRVEYFIGLNPACDDIASALAALGLYAMRESENVDHGHTIPADGPLWSGTEMSALLVLRQFGDILPALALPNGIHVDFLQAVPVFDSERRFKASFGTDALLQRWETMGTPFWDPRRGAEPAA
jgi:hypothetical protein